MKIDSFFQPSVSDRSLLWTQLYDNLVAFPAPTGSGTFYTSTLNNNTAYDSLGKSPLQLYSALNTVNSAIRSEFIIASGDVSSGTNADIDPVFQRSFVANDMPGARGNKIVINQLKRTPAEWNAETPQFWPMIVYRYSAANPLPPLCYGFSMRAPANLSSILQHSNPSVYPGWLEIMFFKGTLDNANTQHRLALVLEKSAGETGMRFRVRFDLFNKNLSGAAISASVPTALWAMLSDEGSLIAGDTYDIYLYFNQQLPTTNLSGVVSVLIINTSRNIVAMSDSITDVPTCGYDAAPVGRIAFHGCYTGGFPDIGDIQIEYSNTQIWSGPPILML